jgi:PAS domain S-box-containing protein
MIENAEAVSQGKRSVVNMFFVYVGISSLLFFFVALFFFIPLMNDSFDDLQEKKSKQSANDYALKLSVYLDNRLLVLNDLASSALIANTVLLGEKNNPALADFLDTARLLGEDPSLTLVDVNGSVLLSEEVVGGNIDYRWVQPLLEGLPLGSSVVPVSELINFIVEDSSGISLKIPLFELAVPVTYGNSRDGVLVARINASPRVVYSGDLLKTGVSGVQYSKQKKMIQSDINSIVLPDKEAILIDAYSISFSHFASRSDVKASKRELWVRLSVAALISSVVMCFGLFFLGRKNILQPYIKLAALQNAVSKAVEGISFIDPSGCYVSLNHAYAGAAGYLPEELEGKPWSVTVHPDDLPMLNEAYQTMLDEGVVTAEARGRRKDGSTFYKQVSMITQYDDKGGMIGHHCFLKDISARKVNERQQEDLIQALARTNSSLVDSQEKILIGEKNLRAIHKFQTIVFDNVPDMLFVKDSEFRIVQANQAFLNVYPEDMRNDVIGRTSLEGYEEEEREAFLVFDRIAFDKGFSETEETIQFPDGKRRTLLTKKVRFQDELGAVFILGVASDITDIKQAQCELLKSEQRYEVAVKGSSVGLWDFDIVTNELYWSDRFKGMVGVQEEFTGKLEEFTERLHPEDKVETLRAFNAHLENKSPYVVEYRFQKADGNYMWVHAEGQALWDVQGEPIRVAGSVEDITQRKQAEIEREKLIDSLAKSNEGLEHFAFICSHDLQEPLRVIRSFSERLQSHIGDSLEGDDKAQLYFKFIVDGAARAQVLIADILAYSRVESDTQVLEDVDTGRLVDAVKQHLQVGLDGDQRKVSYDALPVIVGNKTQLYQLLQNLVNNGLKYQAAEVLPKVHVSAADMGDGYWQFSVKDNGIGIEPRYQKQIFDVFKRLHGQGEYAGTGVGLAICKKVVERHAGRLWVESARGEGATFHFTLPIIEGDVLV